MTTGINLEMQNRFLDARNEAERQGYGGAAYVHGLRAVAPLIQRDALRMVWDAMVSPAALGLDSAGTRIACAQVERIARELGVTL